MSPRDSRSADSIEVTSPIAVNTQSPKRQNGRATPVVEEHPPYSCCSCRRLICLGLSLVVAGGITFALLWYFGKPSGAAKLLAYGDPPGLSAANSWETTGQGGLSLIVENAMEDKYVDAFNEYITSWDNGSPDALALTAVRVTPEVVCDPSVGHLKICSGDYGNTDWRGINFNYVSGGFILHSISKVNNYHLDNENNYQQRYTICHELGHGFGLAHTDEDYWNLDRGDCMDYTVRPERNLEPGSYNFGILEQLYGTVVTRTRRHLRTKSKNGKHRALSGDLKTLYDKAIEHMEGDGCTGDSCVVDLGDDIQIVAHKLRV